MSSRIDNINEIATELNDYIKQTKDDSVAKALERIMERLVEARNYFEMGEDYTGQKCTSRMIGSYLLKTWRMTSSKDFNKLIIKKMPAQYRKMTALFNKINELSEEVLGYDYKHVKAAEDQAQKVIPFIQRAEKGFRLAGEREKDLEKSDFLTSVATDFMKLLTIVYSGKDETGALVSTKEIKEKTTDIWSSIEDIEWDDFITDDLHNPTFALKEVSERFPTIMDPYMEKKFIPKKDRVTSESSSEKMKEDAVHIEFDRSKRKAPLQKRGTLAAKKGGIGVKKGAGLKKGSKLSAGKKKLGKTVLARKTRPGGGPDSEDEAFENGMEAPETIEIPEMADEDAFDEVEEEAQKVSSVRAGRPGSPPSGLLSGGKLKPGGLGKPAGRTWLTADSEDEEEAPPSPGTARQTPAAPVRPDITETASPPEPEAIAPKQRTIPSHPPKAFEPRKEPLPGDENKPNGEQEITIISNSSAKDEFDDDGKKGCLPFVVGAASFIILVIYTIIQFR